jgi:LysR family transcriptional regulator, regulator for metE and metH
VSLIAPAAPPSWPRPRLEVRDLEFALALAAAGTTAGAASALGITQSAVSRALSQAEARVGARLFERGARGVTPTAAGERLVAEAGPVLAQLCELERQVAAPAVAPTRLRLVCECYTAYRWLPSAVANLRHRLPGLELDVAVEHTHDPVGALTRDEIDVALLTTAPLPRAGAGRGAFAERPLFSDEVVFVVATSHPLAGRRSITPDDLCCYPVLSGDAPAAEVRWFLTSVFGRKPPKLDFVKLPLTEAIIDTARAGMGIAILSEWMAGGYVEGGGLALKRLSSGPLRRPWRIAYRRGAQATAERLADALRGSAPRLSMARAG